MWPFASKQDVHEEVQQLRTEFNQSLQSMQQALLTELRQKPATPPMSSDLIQLSSRVFNLELQIKELTKLLYQLSATTASNTAKPIHEAIQARINLALSAIHALGNEHANWLEQHRYTHDEIRVIADQLQAKLQDSAHHVFPSEQDKEPITQV